MTNSEELEKFKEEMLKRIIEVEKSIVYIQPRVLESKLNDVLGKFDKYTERLNEIEKMANKDKVLIDSIHDLKTREWDSQQTITNHEIKLNSVSKDLKDSISKYDKIYLENLFLPGIIGESNCRFKNMKEFIEVSE
jgi:hypothetical protein